MRLWRLTVDWLFRRGRTVAALRLGAAALLGFTAMLFLAWFGLRCVPLPAKLFDAPPAGLELTDRHGTSLRHLRSSEGGFSRRVTFEEIPQALVHATLAAEDRRFWEHGGVDGRSTARAAWHLVRYRRIISGGSTITQQLIKIAQPRPRTFRTKLLEAVQALRLEQVWDKQRILLEYLNRLDYGNLNLGCAAAAEFYFGKTLPRLTIAECALLAGLPQAPTRLNPVHHRDRAIKRQQWILREMRDCGFITAAELDRALAEKLGFAATSRAFRAPHFAELLLSVGWQLPGHPPMPASGRVQTTLDLELNRFTRTTIRRQLKQLASLNARNSAAVVIDNATGGVLALVGSEDYFSPRAGQVNGAWAPRSAGSTFKPFTYLLAFEKGATPATIVADVPTDFSTATGLFSPLNYDRRFYGPMTYRLALANSLNVSAVKTLESIGGAGELQRRLQACGLTTLNATPEHYGLGLTIGNAEARLLELANAYACLARLGQYRPCILRAGLTPSASQVCDPIAAFLIADILTDNSARSLAFGPDSPLRFDFPVACKTGTSSNFRDNWAFGYTPEFTVGVWVGNFDAAPMSGVSGVSGAAPILHDLMQHLHDHYGTSWYAPPATLVRLPVHKVTGKRLPPSLSPNEYTSLEWLPSQHLPPEQAQADFDPLGRIKLSTEYQEWLATSDNWLAGKAVSEVRDATLRILFPQPGTVFYLDPDLPGAGGKIPLKAAGGQSPAWHSDTLECFVDQGKSFAWLKPGKHRLQVYDAQLKIRRETWVDVTPK
ncbi:MAG TPA: penicillin-binding protein 1C [Clostridia bacterium]|nr:penicillin-binding protein 1C [Clostridia bacterium]